MSVLYECPYYMNVRIICLSVLYECPYYMNVRIICLSVLYECPYYMNVRIICCCVSIFHDGNMFHACFSALTNNVLYESPPVLGN